MKIVALLANLAFIIFLAVMVASARSSPSGSDIFGWAILFAFALVNILALWMTSKHRDYVSLYFERKRLEQQIKIAQLRKQLGE